MADSLGYNPPQPVTEILPVIEAEWHRWLDVLDRVPANRIAEPGVCGRWSVKDLIGHVAVWDRQVLEDIDAYVAKQPPLAVSADDVNRREADRRSGMAVDDVVSEMHQAHERMLEQLTPVSEIDPKMVGVDTWEHYAEHATEIERWLASAPGEP